METEEDAQVYRTFDSHWLYISNKGSKLIKDDVIGNQANEKVRSE